jgi:predicted membrane-bound spermidine synthase
VLDGRSPCRSNIESDKCGGRRSWAKSTVRKLDSEHTRAGSDGLAPPRLSATLRDPCGDPLRVNNESLIDVAWTPGGEEMTLTYREGHFCVNVGKLILMSSAEHDSEECMADLAMGDLADIQGARVLIGGLGMGYTLRAALDRLGLGGSAVVVELMPAVVEWNRGLLADLAERPLDDPRASLVVQNFVDYLDSSPDPFHSILLDVDNGPDAFTSASNHRIYGRKGLQRLHSALRPGGTLVVWSSYESPAFVRKVAQAGFAVRVVQARSGGDRDAPHTLFVCNRR